MAHLGKHRASMRTAELGREVQSIRIVEGFHQSKRVRAGVQDGERLLCLSHLLRDAFP